MRTLPSEARLGERLSHQKRPGKTSNNGKQHKRKSVRRSPAQEHQRNTFKKSRQMSNKKKTRTTTHWKRPWKKEEQKQTQKQNSSPASVFCLRKPLGRPCAIIISLLGCRYHNTMIPYYTLTTLFSNKLPYHYYAVSKPSKQGWVRETKIWPKRPRKKKRKKNNKHQKTHVNHRRRKSSFRKAVWGLVYHIYIYIYICCCFFSNFQSSIWFLCIAYH